MPKKMTGDCPELKPVKVGAAAIDIGSKMHMAAVDPTCTETPVLHWHIYTRSARSGGLVQSVRRDQRGDGIYRGLLDPGLRDS